MTLKAQKTEIHELAGSFDAGRPPAVLSIQGVTEVRKKEFQLQLAVEEYLESKQIFFFRLWPGLASQSGSGKGQNSYSDRGVPNLLAFFDSQKMGIIPVWLQIKSRTDTLTPDEFQFQQVVKSKRHAYLTVRSLEDLIESFG